MAKMKMTKAIKGNARKSRKITIATKTIVGITLMKTKTSVSSFDDTKERHERKRTRRTPITKVAKKIVTRDKE